MVVNRPNHQQEADSGLFSTIVPPSLVGTSFCARPGKTKNGKHLNFANLKGPCKLISFSLRWNNHKRRFFTKELYISISIHNFVLKILLYNVMIFTEMALSADSVYMSRYVRLSVCNLSTFRNSLTERDEDF